MIDSMERKVVEIAKSMAAKQDSVILDQLSDLVNRGLLVVELTEPTITTYQNPVTAEHTLEIRQSCKLVFKDKEYIEKLEKDNKEMQEFITKIREVF